MSSLTQTKRGNNPKLTPSVHSTAPLPPALKAINRAFDLHRAMIASTGHLKLLPARR